LNIDWGRNLGPSLDEELPRDAVAGASQMGSFWRSKLSVEHSELV
jgi:hypothetical protein